MPGPLRLPPFPPMSSNVGPKTVRTRMSITWGGRQCFRDLPSQSVALRGVELTWEFHDADPGCLCCGRSFFVCALG